MNKGMGTEAFDLLTAAENYVGAHVLLQRAVQDRDAGGPDVREEAWASLNDLEESLIRAALLRAADRYKA